MLCKSQNPIDTPQANWQQALKNVIRDPAVLLDTLALDARYLAPAQQAAQLFPLRVPTSFVARMQKGNIADPLLMQVLPLQAEMTQSDDYQEDPLQERSQNPLPGLLHKFKGRVLLTASSACAVHCRYCFRRHFPYADNNPGKAHWQKVFDYIAQDNSIHEVILSGGDPLTLDDTYLAWFIEQLSAILHVKIVRVHTRLPIVLPERCTPDLITALTHTRLKAIMVVHCNHAQEINTELGALLQSLRQHMPVLNQAVLLRGVNDDVTTLCELSYKLFQYDVLPYYLHQLDKVQGAQHFAITDQQAITLHKAMATQLPGYLLPKLVAEVPGMPAKQMLY